MKSFDVLSLETVIGGVHLLEASAGTGKTFAMEHLACRLILEKGLTLDQILLVTFTRAATRDLKRRVQGNLKAILDCLERKEVRFDYLRPYMEEEQHLLALQRIEEALLSFDSAPIFTIHGFCHRMLTECAFESGQTLSSTSPDSQEYRREMLLQFKDFLHSHLDPSKYSPRQLNLVLKKERYDISSMLDKALQFLEKRSEIEESADFSTSLSLFQRALALLPSISSSHLKEDFLKLAPCYKKMGGPAFLAQVELLGALIEKKRCSATEFDELLKEKEWFFEGMNEGNLKVRAALPPASALHCQGIFERLGKELLPILAEAADPLKIFLRMVRECQGRRALFQNNQISPDQLLEKMERSLKLPAFVEAVQRKYKAAFIDEFQDTDSLQWNIFSTLFLLPEAKIEAFYLVGDPKQSIYGFRSADVYTYLKAAAHVGKEARSSLTTNFRSQPHLVSALNELFSVPGLMPLPKEQRSLEIAKVQAREKSSAEPFNDELGSVHFFLTEGKAGREKQWPTQESEEGSFFPYIASEIVRLALPLDHYAILVKDRYQALRLQSYLKKVHIAAHIKRRNSLADSYALKAMQELVGALAQLGDSSALKQFLGGPLTSFDAFELQDAELVAAAQMKLLELAEMIKQRGFGVFFTNFLATKFRDGQSVLEQIASHKELTFYSQLRQLSEWIMERGLFSSIERVQEALLELSSSQEQFSLKEAEENAAVSILTIHMSKGLEFEVVFALGLASRHTRVDELMTKRLDGKEYVMPLLEESQEWQDLIAELDAEKMRQLYVALTRAKRRVYVPFVIDQEGKEIAPGKAAAVELFFSTWLRTENISLDHLLEKLKISGDISWAHIARAPFQTTLQTKPLPLLTMPESLSLKAPSRQMLSFSALHQSVESQAPLFLLSEKKSRHTLPPGAETGTLLHQLLEIVLTRHLFSPFNEEEIRALIQKRTAYSHFKEWQEVLYEIIHLAFHTPLTSAGFSLSAVKPERIMQEMEFVYPYGENFLKGFADLIFEHEGKVYLLDWKSNWLGPSQESYTPSALEEAMKQHDYFLQAHIYTNALQRTFELCDKRPFTETFGGAFYLFLRGPATFHIKT